MPRFPGAFSALGALISETRFDYRQTCWMVLSQADVDKANGVFADLEARAADEFRREGITEKPEISRTVELRYLGQNFELEVPVQSGALDLAALKEAVDKFNLEHHRLYGYSIPGEECEFLNFNISARLAAAKMSLPKIEAGGKASPIGKSDVYLGQAEHPISVPLYDRAKLGAGTVIEGPAIIGQMDSTTLLPTGAHAEIDDYGNMLIDMNGGQR